MYKMSSFRIIKTKKVDVMEVSQISLLPLISSSSFPPNANPGIGGAIAYDTQTQRVYYNNGINWLPIQISSGTATSYSIIKNGEQTITTATDSIITAWTDAPEPPYHDLTSNWNLATGVYTADADQTLSVQANISWKAGISNLGNRTLRIIYKPVGNPAIVAKEVVTQADPNMNVETTQEAVIFLKLNVGDQAWINVRHDAPIDLVISTGIYTSISGAKIDI